MNWHLWWWLLFYLKALLLQRDSGTTEFYLVTFYQKCNFIQYSLKNKTLDCQTKSHDILFNLHKKVINSADGNRIEVICMGRLINSQNDKRKFNAKKSIYWRFLKALEQTDIRRSDPRLGEMVKFMNDIKANEFDNKAVENLELDKTQFKRW